MREMQLLIFVLILSVLILVHELGHFFAARFLGIRVEEFGIGLPPKAKKLFAWNGVEFSLNWLPLGGFVRLYGEDREFGMDDKNAFFNKPMISRLIVLLAGVTMNFILGVALFGVVYSFLGIPTQTDRVRVVEVVQDSPAEKAGLKVDDIISKIQISNDKYQIDEVNAFIKKVNENKGKEISLVLDDGRELKVTPRENPPAGQGSLGVALSSMEMIQYPWWQMPFRGVVVGMNEAVAWGKEIATNMWKLVSDIFAGKGVPKDVSGPVGIYQVTSQVYKNGWLATLQFVGVLSVNLAILNIMPLPALDGGRIAFLGIELLVGKRRKNKIEGYVHSGGMIFLLALMALITIRDVMRLVVK